MNKFWFVRLASRLTPWRDRTFSGKWEIKWKVRSVNFPSTNSNKVEVYKFLNYFAAEGIFPTVGGQKQRYGFVGTLRGGILTGSWYDTRSANNAYYGTFQVVMGETRQQASGKWLGFSHNRGVKSDDMYWRRLS